MNVRPLGLWPDSRAVYAIGAFISGIIGCAVISFFVSPNPVGELGFYALILGGTVGVGLMMAALVGFHLTAGNPRLHPVLRWLALCVLAWLVLSMITVVGSMHSLRGGLEITLPMVAIHAVWTALFLFGRRPR